MMGAVKRWVSVATGADQVADAAERQAEQQASAMRQAADASAAAAREAAAQTARQQEANIARQQVVAQAADAAKAAAPVENAEVQLDLEEDTTSQSLKKRRQKFGVGSSASGVNI